MNFLLTAAVLLSLAAPARAQEEPGQTPEPPAVSVEERQGSPLRILSVQTKWATPARTGIELYITVENVSGKAVSAYTTRDAALGDPGEGTRRGRSCLLIRAASPGKALRPGRTEGRSTWTGYDPAARLRRVVDFVEFTDGTTWGEDVCGMAEVMAASRAGAREARRRLREVFASGGADAVIEILKPGRFQAEPPEDSAEERRRVQSFRPARGDRGNVERPDERTLAWRQGYRSGFESYADRIRRAEFEWGYTEIEHALGRPVDALEDKER